MIDRAARKVGQVGAGGGDAGLPFLIGIADDGVGVGDIKIIANQSDAKGRIEVIQEDGSLIGNAIAIGVAQQRDAVSALGCGAGEPRYPGSDYVLWAVDRRFWTIALNHQHVSVWEDVERPWMREASGQCMDLQSLRHRRSFLFPPDDSRYPDRRYQILLQCGQRGIGADFFPRVTALIVTAGESKSGHGDKEKG
jgi:hypothetical protein